MKTITSSEFVKAPGRHLEAVFKGESIQVTRYGRPYVVLSPPAEAQEPKETVSQAR